MATHKKILQIGNYPPPMCGWAMQLKLVTEELRRRGHECEILKINEGRQIKSPDYVDVQSGLDYLLKVWKFSLRGFCLNVHVNGMSKKGYALALAAAITGRIVGRPALVTFHGGLSQDFFPRHDGSIAHWAFYILFALAGRIACDSQPIQDEIVEYGIARNKVRSIATFSPQYLQFSRVALPNEVDAFLQRHDHVFLSYVSFRAEYRLDVLRQGMKRFRETQPRTGYIWLGFPGKELPAAEEFVGQWPHDESESLLLLGNLNHDQFLTLLSRCAIYLRTPACDGVAASVLEALALRVPVVASENDRRPPGVITYQDTDAADMVDKLSYAIQHLDDIRSHLQPDTTEDNVGQMADWLIGKSSVAGGPLAVAQDKTITTRSGMWR
jgi:glycosyltransferase involved in cell wall biosynthesis